MDLPDAGVIHGQADAIPVGVGIGRVKVGERRDADGPATAGDALGVERVHAVEVGDIPRREGTGNAGCRLVA